MVNVVYRNALAEVSEILNYVSADDYEKLPSNVISAINENKNNEYVFILDMDKPLKEQQLLEETRAILFNLYRDYLCTKEQREKIKIYQTNELYKKELEKQSRYDIDIFKAKKKEEIKEVQTENTQMIEYKENILKRIINRIRAFFIK